MPLNRFGVRHAARDFALRLVDRLPGQGLHLQLADVGTLDEGLKTTTYALRLAQRLDIERVKSQRGDRGEAPYAPAKA